jgi:hypothetical protein
MPSEFRAENFRAELIRRGLPRSYAERVAHELADHWEDLRREAILKGATREHAELFASGSLGDWDQLALAFHSAHLRMGLPGRYSFMVFFFGPILLFTALFALALALGAMAGYLARLWGRETGLTVLDWVMLGIAVRAIHAGTLVITQAAFCWLAWRYRLGLRCAAYSAVGLSIHGLIHQVTFQAPGMGTRGSLMWSYGFGADLWAGVAPFVCLAVFSWLMSKHLSRTIRG